MTKLKAKEKLKEVVKNIVIGQGNDHIKELLRKHEIKIGHTKADFFQNISDAIDADKFTLSMLDSWIDEVEGWGKQHIYLYNPLSLTVRQIKAKIQSSELAHLLDKGISYSFPDELTLTTISLTADSISFLWHKGNTGWIRTKAKDFQKAEGLDLYEYRAYRHKSDREVVRFEWVFDDPYSALYIQQPLKNGSLHDDIQKSVWKALIAAGLISSTIDKISLNSAANNLILSPDIVISTTAKRQVDGGYVEYGVTTDEGGIEDVAAVRDVNLAIDASSFNSTTGKFKLTQDMHASLARDIILEVFGDESRIRVWVQCNKNDVKYITNLTWQNN